MDLTWQQRRSNFNHNWLKNKFIVKLQAGINLIEGCIEDPAFEQVFVADLFLLWQSNKGKIIDIINSFETEMSPNCYFENSPINKLDNKSKQWLALIVHQMWYTREDISTLTNSTLTAFKQADMEYKYLKNQLENHQVDCTLVAQLNPYCLLFKQWRDACQELSWEISQFPRTVKIT